MEKSNYLLKYRDNWADEFDVNGCVIISEDTYKDIYLKLENAVETYDTSNLNTDYMCVYIGSNENIEYESLDDFMNTISCRELSDEEARVLSDFGFSSYGHTGFYDLMCNIIK